MRSVGLARTRRPPGRPKPFLPLPLLLLLAPALAVVLAAPAYGHAVVLHTVPADGALLESAPAEIVIRFNEPVALIEARVLDAAGNPAAARDAATARGRDLRITLPPALADGSYVVSYRVVSADSHPVGGSIVFSIGSVSGHLSAPAPGAGDGGWKAAMIAIRALLYAGVLGGAGAVLYLLLVRPPGPLRAANARVASGLAAAGTFAALLAGGIHGGLLLGGPMSRLTDPATWKIGWTSGYGTTALTAMIGLALVATGLRRQGPAWRLLARAGAFAALLSFALSGHVLTAGPRWLTAPVLVAHTAAVAFWIGALIPLRQAVQRLGSDAAPLLRRFSRAAAAAVGVLVAAGAAIAVLQVASFRGLFTTTYGFILLVKLALVAGLLALAAANKLRLTPALARGEAGAAGALRGTITAEIAFALAILVATAALGTTRPPRALAEATRVAAAGAFLPASGLSISIAGAQASAVLVFASAHAGPNRAELRLSDSAGAPLAAQEVTLTAANPAAGVEPISRQARPAGPGAWRVPELLLVPGGTWSIRLEVLVNDFEKIVLETTIEL